MKINNDHIEPELNLKELNKIILNSIVLRKPNIPSTFNLTVHLEWNKYFIKTKEKKTKSIIQWVLE